ncbi:hypothetical protein B0J13DRAFT_44398 [Dactylonectria estremocensis]|uniref:Extracellular membrane protein CFEM domain-containing protein n=1 Tax=Dactylonectria estremocensis TaxID=1079267 RepID=A0A9P9J7B2_9HYPO|nr:hypothetical protein B0J13DRAFT_44398 [Dactylonectria estremocensis]
MLPQTARRLPRLSLLLIAASCASATLVLSNFEDISKKSVTSSCRSAYNTPLTNCDPGDFGNNSCSSSCKTSIEEAQSNIQSDCADVTLSSGSLLSRAQEGKLVQVICKNGGEDDDEENESTTATTLSTSTKSNQNQMIETSTITRKSSTATTGSATATATDTKQTTSLVLAGDDSTGSVASSGTGTAAAATSTAKSGSSGGGDPFASNDTGAAGRSVNLGYASLVLSAVACLMAVM